MRRLQRLIARSLERTQEVWPDLRRTYAWVHEAAHLLKNEAHLAAGAVARRFAGLLGAMARHRAKVGNLAGAIDHFLTVSRSYWPGLFHCYAVPNLPRTNNDLEHLFGSHRYHERRATGRKTASPTMVLRGPVRLVAATATRLRCFEAHHLAAADQHRWATLRANLQQRRHSRCLRARFRRDPDAFLKQIETDLFQSALPS